MINLIEDYDNGFHKRQQQKQKKLNPFSNADLLWLATQNLDLDFFLYYQITVKHIFLL